MTPAESTQKRIRDRERAFKERTERQFGAFKDCYDLVTERARAKAAKLMEADKLRFKSRSFESLVGQGVLTRMVTQIYHHSEWRPEDCGRWLQRLGMEPTDVQWILEQVSRRRCRAAWAKVGGLKPGTRL
jgi:hypothetical protein